LVPKNAKGKRNNSAIFLFLFYAATTAGQYNENLSYVRMIIISSFYLLSRFFFLGLYIWRSIWRRYIKSPSLSIAAAPNPNPNFCWLSFLLFYFMHLHPSLSRPSFHYCFCHCCVHPGEMKEIIEKRGKRKMFHSFFITIRGRFLFPVVLETLNSHVSSKIFQRWISTQSIPHIAS
jgi:hypothetical protein